jgi:hypothetical protein
MNPFAGFVLIELTDGCVDFGYPAGRGDCARSFGGEDRD